MTEQILCRIRRKNSSATARLCALIKSCEEKFLFEPLKKILPSQYPVLKPMSLPDY